MTDVKPISESYWVEPGRVLAGEHPGHWDESAARRRIAGLLDAGIRVFIDLTVPGEPVHAYQAQLKKACGERGLAVKYISHPLPEDSVPLLAEDVTVVLRLIQSALDEKERVYVHCGDGVGRTGMVMGCWLVECGLDPEDALDELVRRFGAMQKARNCRVTPTSSLQAEWVENWEPRLGIAGKRSQAS
jgi:protein tyrosine/serine phosphatase